MKQLLSLLVLVISFSSFSQTVILSTPDATVCEGEQICFSISTSVPGTSPVVNVLWSIFFPGGSTIDGNTNGSDFCIPNAPQGTFDASVIVQYADGTAQGAQAAGLITVVPGVSANISASVNSCNVPFGVTYGIGSSTPPGIGMTYNWTFASGNPATFTGENPPMINYATPGDYNVTLTVTNTITGCSAVSNRTMNVSNFNTAMTIPATACEGEGVTFNDNSTVGANSWTWSATPGVGVSGSASFNAASSQNPSVTFSAPGTYTINLASSNTSVPCNSTATGTITILPKPTPSFTFAPNTGCAPLPVIFTNTSPAIPGAVFTWNFGDGTPNFTGANPGSHVYTGNGSYTPSVSVVAGNGCSASTSNGSINLSSPVANFRLSKKDGCEGEDIVFTDLSTGPSPVISWEWNFGLGTAGATPSTSTNQNPTVNFACGMYDVQLIVTIAGGCKDTVILSQGAIPNGTGYETSTSGAPNLLLKYGTHTTPDFTQDHKNDCIKKPFEFEDITQIACPHDPADVQQSWFFNEVPEGSGPTYTKMFTDTMQNTSVGNGEPGTDVWLEINFRGCRDTTKRLNQIYISAPISKFALDQTLFCDVDQSALPLVGKTVTVNDLQSIYGHKWDNNLTPQSPLILDSIIPNQAADDVVLIYKWNDGTPNTVEDNDTFLDDNPADGGDNGGGIDPANFTLNPTTTATPVTHTFLNYGTYTVWQIIENRSLGCIDSSSVTVHVSWVSTDYVFDESPLQPNDDRDSVCIGSQFSMIPTIPITQATHNNAQSNHSPLSYVFTSNPGFAGASGSSPTASFTSSISTPGIYPILLTTTNAVGCSATASADMSAFALPIANFALTDVSGCVGEPYPTQPTNSSVHAPGGYTLGQTETGWHPTEGFTWTINGTAASGSPSGSYIFSPVTSVTQNTTYTLVVKDALGCVSSPFSASAIVNQPFANLNIANQVCNSDIANGMITFTGNGNIATYEWIIDGTPLAPSTNQAISFPSDWSVDAPATSETHNVSLIVTDQEGCKDTLLPAQQITIIAPQALFTDVRTGTSLPGGNSNEFACPPVVVNFTDASLSSGAPVTSWSWQLGIFSESNFLPGGSQVNSTVSNPTGIQYLFAGDYDLRYIISAGGCIDTLEIDNFLSIQGPSGTPNITLNPGVCGQKFTFELTNTNNVNNWSWDLGDGSTVTSAEEGDNLFIHDYTGVQTYYPTITLFDDLGCPVPYRDTVIVEPNGVEAFFTANPQEINLGTTVTFDDQSSSIANIIQWVWDFGDGRVDTVANGNNQTNQYFVGGDINVTLTITDDRGCSDDYTLPFYIDVNFEMPNVFTGFGSGGPNADLAIFADVFKDFEISIVNRWGNVVYEGKRDPLKPRYLWNGIDQKSDKLCNEGTYYYILKGVLKNDVDVNVHGFVTLIGTKE